MGVPQGRLPPRNLVESGPEPQFQFSKFSKALETAHIGLGVLGEGRVMEPELLPQGTPGANDEIILGLPGLPGGSVVRNLPMQGLSLIPGPKTTPLWQPSPAPHLNY